MATWLSVSGAVASSGIKDDRIGLAGSIACDRIARRSSKCNGCGFVLMYCTGKLCAPYGMPVDDKL